MFEDLKGYAKENKIPIILDEGLEVLFKIIKENKVSSVLEIGTAIGYSAIRMACLGVSVTTIERNEEMHKLAEINIKNYRLNDKIELIFSDALNYTPNKSFDLIFIDAAKSQNIKFFERFSPFLNEKGFIVVDNLAFHGLVENNINLSRSLKQMVRKIQNFIDWLKENNDFETIFINKGDGLSVSRKK